MSDKPMFLNTASDAATRQTVTGWVSRTGRYWGDDERMARWDGCTHVECACGQPVEKSWLACQKCRDARDDAKWLAMPLVEWDGKTPFCTPDGDEYFFDEETFYDWCEDGCLTPSEVQLVLAEPTHYRQLDADYWVDEMPEDGDLPDEIQAAVDALNKVIAGYGKASVWFAGKQRIVMPNREATP